MKAFIIMLALAALLPFQARADEKAPVPSAPVAPQGLEFRLLLPKDKTRFMVGETIRLRLSFANRGKQTLYLSTFEQAPPSLAKLATFSVEPREGVRDPLGDLPPRNFFILMKGIAPSKKRMVCGYVPPPVRLGEKPTEIPFVLNEFLRFDRPGTYTLRATTSRVRVLPPGQKPPRLGLPFMFGSAKTLVASTSEPLAIEITPADADWQHRQVEAWRAKWKTQRSDGWEWRDRDPAKRPEGDLRFLNTREAAQAMIDRLGQDEFPRSSGSEAYRWWSGFIGFSDRAWLIETMKSALRQPDYAVTQGFLNILAELQGLHHVAPVTKPTHEQSFNIVSERAERANWLQTFAALQSKRGRVRALTVHSLLELGWLTRLQKAPEVQARLPKLVAQVPDIFADLPPLPQQYLLDDRSFRDEPAPWSRLRNPRMAEPLARVWKTVEHEDGWGKERGNLILSRLWQLDPKRGRALILQEMAEPNPRVSFQTLSHLSDKRLPQLEQIWWKHLNQNGADQDIAALLIGRYATDALKSQVEREFAERKRDHMLSSDVNRGLSRYLARVKT